MIRSAAIAVTAFGLATSPAATAEPLSRADMRAYLAREIAPCWHIWALSDPAQDTAVTLSVSLSPDGRVDPASIAFVSSTSDVQATTDEAYAAARRAVLRCAAEPFDLPVARHEVWRDLELTFDPRPFLS